MKAPSGLKLVKLWESQDGVCGLCDGVLDYRYGAMLMLTATVDHIDPLGTNCLNNLLWAHERCNNRKYLMDVTKARKILQGDGRLIYCKKCGRIKEYLDFVPTVSRLSGFSNTCKRCSNEYLKDYYHSNEKYRKRQIARAVARKKASKE